MEVDSCVEVTVEPAESVVVTIAVDTLVVRETTLVAVFVAELALLEMDEATEERELEIEDSTDDREAASELEAEAIDEMTLESVEVLV